MDICPLLPCLGLSKHLTMPGLRTWQYIKYFFTLNKTGSKRFSALLNLFNLNKILTHDHNTNNQLIRTQYKYIRATHILLYNINKIDSMPLKKEF